METVFIELIEHGGEKLYWMVSVKSEDYAALEYEIEIYNSWMYTLLTGAAPSTAYKDPRQGKLLYLAQSKNVYLPVLSNLNKIGKQYYEIKPNRYFFTLYKINNTDGDTLEIINQYKNKEFEVLNMDELKDLILTPLDLNDVFSIGYMLLPVTEKIIKEY
jgi:hypothetical protein